MSKSIRKNYIFNLIHQILIIVLPLIVVPYISRVLQPEGIGEYSFANSIMTYFILFASLGFGFHAQREIINQRNNIKQQSIVFWEIILCRLIPVGLSFVTNLILAFSGVYGEYKILMLILSINLVSIAFDISFFFQGHEEFGKLVLIFAMIKILSVIGILTFVKQQDDVWLYILFNVSVTITNNVLMWFFLRKKLVKVKLSELKPLRHLKSALVMFIPAIAGSIYLYFDKILINVITHSKAEIGFYEQAEKIIRKSTLIITCLSTVMYPRNIHEINCGNLDQVNKNNYNSIHFIWLLGIPMMFGAMFTASNLIPWFLGNNYRPSIVIMQVFSVLMLVIGIEYIIGGQYLLPNKKDKQFIIATVSGALINLILNIPLVCAWGALGAAIATVISEFSVTLIMLCFAAKDMSIWQILQSLVKPLVAGLIMCVVICPLSIFLTPSILHTFIIILAGVTVYSLAILILRDNLVMTFLRELKLKFLSKNNKKQADTTSQDMNNA